MTIVDLRTLVLDRLRWIAVARAGSAAVAQNVLTRIFLLFVNLANGIFTARHLGPTGRGEQAAIGLWMPIFIYIFMFGVPSALRYHGRRQEDDSARLYGASLVIAVGLGLIATGFGIALVPHLLHGYGQSTIGYAQTLMIFCPIGLITLVVGAMLDVRFDFAIGNFMRYAPPLLTLATLSALALAKHLTPFTAVLAYVVPPIPITAATGLYVALRSKISLARFGSSAKRLLSYGARLSGSEILTTFSTQIDQVLVVGLLSASQLGGYTIALQASRVLALFQISLSSVLLSKVAGQPTQRVVDLVAMTARLTLAITAVAGFALIVLLPILIPTLYGHDYTMTILVAQILSIEAILSAGAGTHTQAFAATNRPATATLLQFGGLATAIPIMLFLIPAPWNNRRGNRASCVHDMSPSASYSVLPIFAKGTYPQSDRHKNRY